MMPSLEKDLVSPDRHQLVNLLIDLIEAEHVMIRILFRAVERTEFAVHIAHIRVVDVPVNHVGHHLFPFSAVIFPLRQIPSHMGSFPEFCQGPPVHFPGLLRGNPTPAHNPRFESTHPKKLSRDIALPQQLESPPPQDLGAQLVVIQVEAQRRPGLRPHQKGIRRQNVDLRLQEGGEHLR